MYVSTRSLGRLGATGFPKMQAPGLYRGGALDVSSSTQRQRRWREVHGGMQASGGSGQAYRGTSGSNWRRTFPIQIGGRGRLELQGCCGLGDDTSLPYPSSTDIPYPDTFPSPIGPSRSGPPIYTAPPVTSSGSGFNWGQFTSSLLNVGGQLAASALRPTAPAGYAYNTTGQLVPTSSLTTTLGSSSTLLLIGGAGLLLLLVMMMRR